MLFILTLTWGSSFIMIKKSLLEFSPYEIGSLRILISGAVLAAIGIPALLKMTKKDIFYTSIVGLCGGVIPLFFFPIAQTHISSSLAGVLDSLVPLFVLILGFLVYGTRFKTSQVTGVLIGFIGVISLVFFAELNEGNNQFVYAILPILACLSYAISALLIREKLMHVRAIHLTSAMLTLWIAPAFLALWLMGTFSSHQDSEIVLSSLGFISILAIMGTAVAIIIYNKLIQDTGAIFASTVSYLLPVVAVLWGLYDGEEFTFWYILSGSMILVGIYLIQKKDVKKPM